MAGSVLGMTYKTNAAGRLTRSERIRMLDCLQSIDSQTVLLETHLIDAASRQDVPMSAWTTSQLDALIDAAKALSEAVRKAPLIDT